MSKAPARCQYCDGTGWMKVVGVMNAECGFCDNGRPLDTQEDWDESWGRILDGDLLRDPDRPAG